MASWLVALLLLALVVNVNEVVAQNTFFLRVHDTSPLIWLVGEAVVLVIAWVGIAFVLRAASRPGPRFFDVTASTLTLLVAWPLLGNVLARTLLPAPGDRVALVVLWLAGLPVAIAVTLLSRHVRMGSILVGFAVVAAVMPLAPAVAATTTASGSIQFDEPVARPSVLWIVADELQYQLAFDETGAVRSKFPAMRRLQDSGTTYTRAFSPANNTDFAIPAMMTGIADVTTMPADDFDTLRDQDGLLHEFDGPFAMAWSSPLFGPHCTNTGCDQPPGVLAKAASLLRDSVAVIGSTALAPPLSDLTPPITGKWRDFGDDDGRASWPEIEPQLRTTLDRDPETPFFAFWHDMDTHVPYFLDEDGGAIYPPGLPDVDAIDVGYSVQGEVTTPELTVLQRRLYAAGAADLDRRIGAVLDELDARGVLDTTMVVLTADHGAAVGQPRHENTGGVDERRIGATPAQAWDEIAHVPLIVKYPGQHRAEVVTQPRSTAQILATVVDTVGGTATTTWSMAPSLDHDLPGGPTFVEHQGSALVRIPYVPVSGAALPIDVDLDPADPDYPFAVGLPASVLGSPVPTGWIPVDPLGVDAPDSSSSQRLLVVTRSARACPAGDTVGLVSVDGIVVGSVLWEQDGNPYASTTRGWSVVPTAPPDHYRYWCHANP